MGVSIVQRKSEARCKLCASPQRAEIDKWLARRGQVDADHGLLTYEVLGTKVLPLLLGGGAAAVSVSSQKRHLGKSGAPGGPHTEIRLDGAPEAAEPEVASEWEDDPEFQALLAEVDRLCALDWLPPSATLQLQTRIRLLHDRAELRKGRLPQVSPDMAARAAQALQKTETDAARGELLGAMTAGLSMVFKKALGGGESPALDAPDVVDGEVAEEADVAA